MCFRQMAADRDTANDSGSTLCMWASSPLDVDGRDRPWPARILINREFARKWAATARIWRKFVYPALELVDKPNFDVPTRSALFRHEFSKWFRDQTWRRKNEIARIRALSAHVLANVPLVEFRPGCRRSSNSASYGLSCNPRTHQKNEPMPGLPDRATIQHPPKFAPRQ